MIKETIGLHKGSAIIFKMGSCGLMITFLLVACQQQHREYADSTGDSAPTGQQPSTRDTVPSPLFTDPNYHGSCDPEVVWNASDNHWYIYYTARPPSLQNT